MNTAKEHWEEHYGERDRVWSGRVNVRLVEVVSTLEAGRALDLGCGEGADACWLAERGWTVVAVDISDTALQRAAAEASRQAYQERLTAAGRGAISTEIRDAPEFYYAEDYHQQYLAKNPDGYCGIGGCGVPFKLAELQVGEKA